MEDKIISITEQQHSGPHTPFAELMRLTENCMNELSQHQPERFNVSASQLEIASCEMLRQVCGLPEVYGYAPEDVRLISGKHFPDITIGKQYGVEVKSTESKSWSSTGSSIMESSRLPGVEEIYILFGRNLKELAEFRCRPYASVMKDISVTHSPRYDIDMTLPDSGEPTIFEKMGLDYEDFRKRKDRIALVRQYYRMVNQDRKSMPWWLEGQASASRMSIRLLADMPMADKFEIRKQIFILYPRIIHDNRLYKDAALWLCSFHFIATHNFRDSFTAGGKGYALQIDNGNPAPLAEHVCAMICTLLNDNMPSRIKATLDAYERHEQDDFLMSLQELNPQIVAQGNFYQNWVDSIPNVDQIKVGNFTLHQLLTDVSLNHNVKLLKKIRH